MKTHIAASLFLSFMAAGPALAEDTTAASLANICKLTGPTSEASKECKALRVDFRAEVNTCMDQLRAKADAKAGMPTSNNAHTARARFLICDAESHAKLGLAFR